MPHRADGTHYKAPTCCECKACEQEDLGPTKVYKVRTEAGRIINKRLCNEHMHMLADDGILVQDT